MVKIKETDAWNLTAECVGKAIGSTQGHGEGKLYVIHTLRGENPEKPSNQTTLPHIRPDHLHDPPS